MRGRHLHDFLNGLQHAFHRFLRQNLTNVRRFFFIVFGRIVNAHEVDRSLGDVGEIAAGCDAEDEFRLGIQNVNELLQPRVLDSEFFEVCLENEIGVRYVTYECLKCVLCWIEFTFFLARDSWADFLFAALRCNFLR